ncbi:hypothetical protein EAG_14886 [Camponotus floridanus]|uniref:Uncharacterized protein n=1 Tax=Camponotus floridanus TaxID=104421 RepID=E2B0W5_CAMFO|nr:hypothetical protein EAG_14886 [Camponotus floridanus]
MTHVLILFIILGVYCALAEKSEFPMTTEHSKKHSVETEDKLLENITRAKNSSQHILDNNREEERNTDKKPRTVLHRDSSLDRDKSTSLNYFRIPAAAAADTVPANLQDRIIITTRFLWRSDIILLNITSEILLTDSDGRRKVGPQVPPEVAVDPEEEKAEAEPTREVSRETVYGSESANRPSALGYGNAGGYSYGVSSHGGYGGRPSGYGGSNGGYGISGTLADGDEFGPGDSAYPDGSVPQHPGNLHAQKAVALKALAGVALIGAAAALASNPVLLPIGIVGGRKKRSEAFSEEMQYDHQPDDQMDYILNMLRRNLYKIQKDSSTNRLIVSPRCVARLTCEIQKDYLSEIDKDVEFLNTQNRKYHLTNFFITRKVLDEKILYYSVLESS